MQQEALFKVRGLKKHYFTKHGGLFRRGIDVVRAVDGIDFDIKAGETFGLVGESGCGKSTLGRQILRLEEPTAGSVQFKESDVLALDSGALKEMRRKAQVIFQDPYSSLNPRKTLGRIVEDPLIIHRTGGPSQRRQRVLTLLEEVGLRPEHAGRYPHEFSGGQRQRACIARALALNPEFVLCDEPVSALDVSIQAQVINLFKDLQERHSLTYLFVSHDLNVVKYISDRVAVMYLGQFVELSGSREIYQRPLHPYTKALLGATPVADPRAGRAGQHLPGDIPSPINPPPGCRFHPRCTLASDICQKEAPPYHEAEPGHWVRCFKTV